MPYHYSDPERENDPWALPDVDIWLGTAYECQECGYVGIGGSDRQACPECDSEQWGPIGAGYWYAFGLPGCLHDSEPCGPYDTAEQALEVAREIIRD